MKINLYMALRTVAATILLSLGIATSATPPNALPQTSTDLDNPILYAIVSNRGVNLNAMGSAGYGPGVLAAWDYGKTVSTDHVDISSGIPAGALWYLTPGRNDDAVEIRNLSFPDGALTHNPGHIISKTTIADNWYIIPNGINDKGLAISSTPTPTYYSCLDASLYLPGNSQYPSEPNRWPLSGGWQPSATDWDGTTWVFVPVDPDISSEEFYSRVCAAYQGVDPDEPIAKTFYRHSYIWDITNLSYIYYDPSNYDDPNARFSIARSYQTENIIYLWTPEFGSDPNTAPGNLRLDLNSISREMESAYKFYLDSLGFIGNDMSCINRYYTNMFIFPQTANNALYTYKSGDISAMSIHPFWFRNMTYYGGAIHELAHCFQGAAEIDYNNNRMNTTIVESCAQFMIASYLKNWPEMEPDHIRSFMANTHLAFLNNNHCYDNPFVYEYWAEKHGRDIMGRLWRYKGSLDPIERYKEMMRMTQEEFVDEMYEAVSHFPTWDLTMGRNSYAPFRNAHAYEVRALGNGVFAPAEARYPRGYGYNAIPLVIPKGADRRVTIQLSKYSDANFSNILPSRMGWRYGLAAYQIDGTTLYSPMADETKTLVWEIPEGTTNLWLVVLGAPKEHYLTPGSTYCDDQFPWKAQMTGTAVTGYSPLPLDTDLAGIADITSDSPSYKVRYYDLTGHRVDPASASNGIYIRHDGSKAEKVVIK